MTDHTNVMIVCKNISQNSLLDISDGPKNKQICQWLPGLLAPHVSIGWFFLSCLKRKPGVDKCRNWRFM